MSKVSEIAILKWTCVLVFCFGFMSCHKPEDRACFKGTGDYDSLEIPLDSVTKFNLYKNLRYRIFQDDERKVVVKGGNNVIHLISLETDAYTASISNQNKCNFLRRPEDIAEVEIHYPFFKDFYVESSDSVSFMNTISGDTLRIEFREGGGSAVLDVDVDFLNINVSQGTADYTLSGIANNAEVKIQNNGFANALEFYAPQIFVFSNSTAAMKINLEGSSGIIMIQGTGDIEYTGEPVNPVIEIKGSGKFIKI